MRAWLWLAFALLTALLFVLGLCGSIVLLVGEPPSPRLGNRALDLSGSRFAVLGDSQKGVTGLRRMLAKLRDERVDFCVHTGDLVSDNDPGHYRLAARTVARSGFEAPILVVPGNHDIKGDPRLFDTRIGPREIDFALTGVRFVTVDDASGAPPSSELLDRRLRNASILFMHVPPFDTKSEIFRPAAGFEDVVALIRKHRIRYVFSGHAHGYRRIENEGTVYIANGVGGDYDSWQLDQKVCATVVDMPDLKDRLIELPASHRVWDNVEHLALGHVGEAYRRVPIGCWGGTLLLLAGWAFTLRRLTRKPRTPHV